MRGGGVGAADDFVFVGGDGGGGLGAEVGVGFDEFGFEVAGEAEEVVDDEYLAVAVGAGADADDGDVDGGGDLGAEGGGDGFEDEGECAGLGDGLGVGDELAGGFFAAALDAGAEGLDALGGEADVGEDGDAVLYEGGDGGGAEGAAFDFYGVAAGFLEGASAVEEGLLGGGLVGHEGHVEDDEGVAGAADDGGGVADHVVEGDGEGVGMAEEGGADGVADEDEGDAGVVQDAGGAVVVGGEAGDFFFAFEVGDGAWVHSFFLEVRGQRSEFRVEGSGFREQPGKGGRVRGSGFREQPGKEVRGQRSGVRGWRDGRGGSFPRCGKLFSMVWKIFAGMGCGGRNFSTVWKSFFHSVENFWGVGGAR